MEQNDIQNDPCPPSTRKVDVKVRNEHSRAYRRLFNSTLAAKPRDAPTQCRYQGMGAMLLSSTTNPTMSAVPTHPEYPNKHPDYRPRDLFAHATIAHIGKKCSRLPLVLKSVGMY
jgi:hypothetical protein